MVGRTNAVTGEGGFDAALQAVQSGQADGIIAGMTITLGATQVPRWRLFP